MNFNYSRADYNALTPKEKVFILKAFETKTVQQTTLIRNAVLNAFVNALRKKDKRFIELWEKPCEKPNLEEIESNVEIVTQSGADRSWVEKIYKGIKGVDFNG